MAGRKVEDAVVRELPAFWSQLSWDDLTHWAGSRSVSRGRAYQRQKRVRDLAISGDGWLLATVQGGERYAVSAWVEFPGNKRPEVRASCTCPIGGCCKHAVATIAEYLEAIATGRKVPVASADDPRWDQLSQSDDEFEDEEDFEEASDEDRWEDDADDSFRSSSRGRAAKSSAPAKSRGADRRTKVEWDRKIRADIERRTPGELADLVWDLVERYPELRQEFKDRIDLNEGDSARLIAQARREIREVTAEPGWTNHWNNDGAIPDYSRVRHRLERLTAGGHADAVVDLGRELLECGLAQVGMSHDDGETALELSGCLEVVFPAVAKSSLSPADKILYVIDAFRNDEYDVIGDSANVILDAAWEPADWSDVADRLTARLKKLPANPDENFSSKYKRDECSSWLIDALEKAGRLDEIGPLLESEARITGSYQRIVRFLIEQGQTENAELWAREGIEKTWKKWPGIAKSLKETLCDLARKRKQWDVVAAHTAAQFFEAPSAHGFQDLITAAGKAKCQKTVREQALKFLETGRSPIPLSTKGTTGKGQKVDPAWPLPVPQELMPRENETQHRWRPEGPHFNVLLEMAIKAGKPDDVLKWYDRMTPKRSGPFYGHSPGDRVAEAVAATHPERALEIYRKQIPRDVPASTSSYELCGKYLAKLRPIFAALHREEEWRTLVEEIRLKNKNRPRFMEILNGLEGRSIVEERRMKSGR